MRTKFMLPLIRILLATCFAGMTTGAQGWQADWDLDKEMAALDKPVRRPIITPFGDGPRRASTQSSGRAFYKQPRPGEQGDFSSLPPSGVGTPSGGGTSGSIGGASGGIGGGGGSGGGSSGNNGQQLPPGQQGPPGPQIDPPDAGNALPPGGSLPGF